MTRPDISVAVSMVNQFMHQPCLPHLQAAKRILCLLVETISHGLFLHNHPRLHLHAYADWVGCYDTRWYTSGFCLFLGTNLVSRSAKKQATVTQLSTEVEYHSVAYCVAKLTWLQLLGEISVSLPVASNMYYNNISATYLALNSGFHACTKHIKLDVHFVH